MVNNIIIFLFVMGNTCENCEKPVNPKEGLREEANKEESKVNKAGEEPNSKP